MRIAERPTLPNDRVELAAHRLQTALADRYRIERELGRGGMATVYLAHDLRHDRPVALKVLLPEVAAAFGPERFHREIRLTARLDHPHILALLDSGEVPPEHGSGGSLLYYVMPYVEGESLRDRLKREKQLPVEDVVRIARQVATALDYTHQLGIVHRDIKPENILLVGDHARVADFGIARMAAASGGEALTQTGVAIGTPAYMSPEQALGEQDVDGRTDVYSLGCIVFEMLVGEAPYTGPTLQAVIARKLQGPVPSIGVVRSGVSPGVEAAVAKALAVVPADRYATAGQFAAALGGGGVESVATTPAARRRDVQRLVRWASAASGAVLMLAAGWWITTRWGDSSRIESLVVLPLENLTGDSAQAYFVDGMHEALTAELSQISALKVISRTSAMRYRGSGKPAPMIARELGVTGLVEGSVAREGDSVRITVQLIHGPTDQRLWGHPFTRELRSILTLHTEVARAIAAEIRTTVTPREQVRLSADRPVNPMALESYLLGRHLWNQRTLRRTRDAIQHFRKALTHDSAYAPAHSALGDAYLWLGEQGGMPQQEGCTLAVAAIKDALQADESLAEAHVAMAGWQLNCAWNWQQAEREYQRALELNSGSAAVHQYYGRSLSRFTRRFDEAFTELRRARELDPLSPTIRAYVGQGYLFARQYDMAGEQLQEALELNPEHALLLHNLGELSLAQGRWTDAVGYLERSLQGPGDTSSHYLAMLGAAYARAGRHGEARSILQELDRRVSDGLVSDFDMAALHIAFGDGDEALALLERGYARRDYWLPEMAAWPWFDSLRAASRYQELLRKMNLPWGAASARTSAKVPVNEAPLNARGAMMRTRASAHVSKVCQRSRTTSRSCWNPGWLRTGSKLGSYRTRNG